MPATHTDIIIPHHLVASPVLQVIAKEAHVEANRLKLDITDYHIVSFSLTVIHDGTALQYNCKGDALSDEIQKLIKELDPGKVLFFENITAKTKDGMEMVIPWFIVRIK